MTESKGSGENTDKLKDTLGRGERQTTQQDRGEVQEDRCRQSHRREKGQIQEIKKKKTKHKKTATFK